MKKLKPMIALIAGLMVVLSTTAFAGWDEDGNWCEDGDWDSGDWCSDNGNDGDHENDWENDWDHDDGWDKRDYGNNQNRLPTDPKQHNWWGNSWWLRLNSCKWW